MGKLQDLLRKFSMLKYSQLSNMHFVNHTTQEVLSKSGAEYDVTYFRDGTVFYDKPNQNLFIVEGPRYCECSSVDAVKAFLERN